MHLMCKYRYQSDSRTGYRDEQNTAHRSGYVLDAVITKYITHSCIRLIITFCIYYCNGHINPNFANVEVYFFIIDGWLM